MTLEQNKTPFFAYLVMAILSIAAIIAVGIIYRSHTHTIQWVVAGAGIALGFIVMARQVAKGGDTTGIGYYIQVGTALVFCLWVVGSVPAV